MKKIANKPSMQNGHAVEPTVKEMETQGATQLRRPKTLQAHQQPQPRTPPAVSFNQHNQNRGI